MAWCEDVIGGVLIGALQYVLGNQLARQFQRHSGGARELFQRPAANAVFVGIVQDAHDVHPGATRGLGAAAQLGVVPPVGGVKLK
ncbi:hypothetical protein ASF61_16880 [Duganella sp. Leaf126]|nr:hypothetical protein ASF61_16880 [Duganella sp. Leaf126]